MKELQQGVFAFLKDRNAIIPGTEKTPERVSKALTEMTKGYNVDLDSLVTLFEVEKDNVNYDQMVVLAGIPFTSLCEHHLMPFTGVAHIGYIPERYLLGASKPARILDAFAQRFQLQERITVQVADFIMEKVQPKGVMVILEAEHTCMTCRGVHKPGTKMLTSAVRGVFREEKVKQEFLELIKLSSWR